MPLKLAKVRGNSMLPRFRSGDYVLAARPLLRAFRTGDIVLARHQTHGLILKRIQRLSEDEVWLEGLNELSSTAAALGAMPRQALVGRLLYHLPRGAPTPNS